MSFPIVDGLRTMELGDGGSSRAWLNDLVLAGTKRATAALLSLYTDENEPWEHVGEHLVLVDDDLNALGVIEVTRVEPTTFGEVTWEFVQAEGEGDTDLDEWREQNRKSWVRTDHDITDETPLLCTYFELVGPTGK